MKTALFFGSFNPIHNGHLMIANYIIEYSDVRELWFVVSPQNPFKKKSNLLADYHRIALLEEAIKDTELFNICDIELRMPRPSYTIDTLTYLSERYPKREFVLLMGADNLKNFHKWKNYEEILNNYAIMVYARHGCEDLELAKHEKVSFYDAPKIEISSSFIRQAIKERREVPYFMPRAAYNYMKDMHFYE